MLDAVIDTNILLRIVTNDIPSKKSEALRILAGFGQGRILLLEAVLAEVIYVLSAKEHYGLERLQIHQALRNILEMPQFHYNDKLMSCFVEAYASTSLDVVDCLVLAYVKAGQAQRLLSFDTSLLSAVS